ncbi:cytochrome P450 [Bradyrhizobium erythrophlei]|uniref:cytochrome P450 n=1 Tax=Bradyrhizobium erythrophlei TaxID=1437360 RepID=UPI003CC7CB08
MVPSTIQFCLIVLSYKLYLQSLVKLVWHAEVAHLAEIHQFPDGKIVETLRFRADREPNKQLAFGYGADLCLGQHLAKMEMRILYEELLRG